MDPIGGEGGRSGGLGAWGDEQDAAVGQDIQ